MAEQFNLEEAIDMVTAVTAFSDRTLVASALKAKNNNLDVVINEILDDRTKFITDYGWDETAFVAPREGTSNPSFVVHPADDGQVLQGVDPGYYQGQIGAPSRPPSRTNNRSPLSRLVDLTSDSTGNVTVPTSVDQEESDLQHAIAASVATSNMQSPQPQPQESGVADVETGSPHFGPANRTDYNQNEWAMITLNHDKPEPDPSRRKREAGVPAFLRCRAENSWETHRVGAILTILHSIPAARNAFLRLGGPALQGYGHNPEWWKGKPILPAAVQASQDAGELTWGDESKPKWTEELHRLMAFLDQTERSYGTADVLADTAPEGQQSGTDSERDFFTFLHAFYTSDAENYQHVKPLITTCESASVGDDEAPSYFSDNFVSVDFGFSKEKLLTAESMYSLWDRTFHMDYLGWVGDEQGAKCVLMTEPAEVLTMRVTTDGGLPRRIDIPQVFYLDRYLMSNRAEIAKIQRQALVLSKALVRAEKAALRATLVVDPHNNNNEINRVELNKAAIAQVKTKRALIKQWALWRMHQEEKERTGKEPQTLPPPDTPDDQINWNEEELKSIRFYDAKILQLEDELGRIEEQLAVINRDRDIVIAAMRELERCLTVPDESTGFTPQAAYTPRGVSNNVDVFYLCLPAEQDLMQIDEDAVDGVGGTKPADQWWRLGYVANDDDPIKAEPTTYEKVVEDACGPGSKPVLIYASEKAMGETPDQLSEALQTFIRFDNRLFKKELTEEIPRDNNDKKRGGFSSPASPSKRLNRSSSVDSMATNAASAGDLDRDDDDMRDAPFDGIDDNGGDPNQKYRFPDDSDNFNETPSLIDTSVPDIPAVYLEDQPPPLGSHMGTRSASVPGVDEYPDRSPSPQSQTLTSSSSPTRGPSRQVGLDEVVARNLAHRDSSASPPPPPPQVPRHSATFPPSTQTANRVPEMQERGGGTTSPFFLRQAGGRSVKQTGGMMDMELDEDKLQHAEGEGGEGKGGGRLGL